MAGAPAGLPAGIRLSDHISLGVIAKTFPLEEVRQVLADDRQGQRARTRPAGPRHGLLRHRAGALHERQHPRGAALSAGGAALALGRGGGPGGGQERHLAGPHAPGRGAAAPAARAGGAADRDARHQGGVVPGVAAGQPGRVLPGRGRHGGERRRLRATRRQPRGERLPAAALRGAGRERHARAVRRSPGRLWRGRDDPGPRRAAGAAAGHAVPGRPAVLRPCALAGGGRHRRRPAVAGEAQPAAAA